MLGECARRDGGAPRRLLEENPVRVWRSSHYMGAEMLVIGRRVCTCLLIPTLHHKADEVSSVEGVWVLHDGHRSKSPIDSVEPEVRREVIHQVILTLPEGESVANSAPREPETECTVLSFWMYLTCSGTSNSGPSGAAIIQGRGRPGQRSVHALVHDVGSRHVGH
jgi:hypothetical protein